MHAKRTYSYRDLRVFNNAMNVSMNIHELTKTFPPEEKYSLTDQIRKSSRSVCANIGEAWRKRRYRAAFIAKLNDAESEACETQVWLEFAKNCGYLDDEASERLHQEYEIIIRQLMNMVQNVEKWLIPVIKK
jgi:four helix bundle protein